MFPLIARITLLVTTLVQHGVAFRPLTTTTTATTTTTTGFVFTNRRHIRMIRRLDDRQVKPLPRFCSDTFLPSRQGSSKSSSSSSSLLSLWLAIQTSHDDDDDDGNTNHNEEIAMDTNHDDDDDDDAAAAVAVAATTTNEEGNDASSRLSYETHYDDMDDYSWELDASNQDDDNNNNNNKNNVSFLSWRQQVENFKCILLGIGVGILSVWPWTAFHYFIYQPSYTSVAQWEFDTYTGAIQGALFALVYRHAVVVVVDDVDDRQPTSDNNNNNNSSSSDVVVNQVIQSFVGVRTLSRIHVSFACTALPLYCGDVLRFLSWDMTAQLVVNYVESAVLFGAVGAALQKALDQKWIVPYDCFTNKKESS